MNARNGGYLLATLLVLSACDTNNVAGTNNETHTKGTLYQANGKVAVGARVRVFAANQDVADSLPVTQTKVDANGQIPLQLKRGYYSLLADDTTHRAVFIDSIFSDGDMVDIKSDTLRPTGSFIGHVRVQPMHAPAIAWVHLMRTNLFANVDSTGAFRLQGVPAGKMELVALTHLPEYTPTFREAQAISDSTVDLGTIDLVYNGLPLVTGLAATYDTLTGVVTLTWHDTAFARKAGYVVYSSSTVSSFGVSSFDLSPLGETTIATFSDTVFGGFGTAHCRYDSAEFDLTYRIGIRSQDLAEGPLWNKVSLHVKSPALAKRWKVDWQTTSNVLAENGTVLDTLAGGLGLLKRDDTVATLRIAGKDGVSSAARFAVPKELEGGPIFWKGRLWMARGYSVSSTVEDNWPSGDSTVKVATWHMFDSTRILSSADGIHWDSTSIATSKDSIDAFELRVSEKGLILVGLYFREYMGAGHQGRSINALESTTGNFWSPLSESRMFLASRLYSASIMSVTIETTGAGSAWSVDTYRDFTGRETITSTWLIPGESVDTTKSALKIPSDVVLRTTPALLVIGQGKSINLAFPDSPALWQRISPPEPVKSFCFWQGKLVVLGETGLHFATITPNQ